MARVRMAVRAIWRADAPLPQAHGCQTFQVCRLRALVRALRPPRATHEAAPTQDLQMTRKEGRRPAARAT